MMAFPLVIQTRHDGSVQLTQERWEHIGERKNRGELRPDLGFIAKTLEEPDEIRASNQDPEVRLYYRSYEDKWVTVVVKRDPQGSFVLTAYMTDRIKQGGLIWQKN